MKNQCIFTNQIFDAEETDDNVSPVVREEIKKIILEEFETNEKFRERVMTSTLSDESIVKQLTASMLGVKAKDIGLITSGSVGDLFRKLIRKNSRQKKQKDT